MSQLSFDTTNVTSRWNHVWITGAGRGIGHALSVMLARQGCRVAASSRSTTDLEQLNRLDKMISPQALDVTDAKAVDSVVANIEASHGAIELAILNAGVYEPLSTIGKDTVVFQQHMEVNYLGVVHCLAALIPRMQARGGGVIGIVGSLSGYRGLPEALAYGPTKSALINLAESLHLTLAKDGVDIRLINPGFVETRLTAKNRFTMPYLMTPEQAAAAILRGLNSSKFEIAFPWQFAYWLKIARLLPYRLYFPLIRRLTKVD